MPPRRRRQRAVDQRAVDDDVDVVEPVAQDRDPDRDRHRGQREGVITFETCVHDGPAKTSSATVMATPAATSAAGVEQPLELLPLVAGARTRSAPGARRSRRPSPPRARSRPRPRARLRASHAVEPRAGSRSPCPRSGQARARDRRPGRRARRRRARRPAASARDGSRPVGKSSRPNVATGLMAAIQIHAPTQASSVSRAAVVAPASAARTDKPPSLVRRRRR